MQKILKTFGNVVITGILLIGTLLVAPKIFGFQEYNVISGSMNPAIPVGSLVYVKGADFDELIEGDVIAFNAGASVVTHRIVGIDSSKKLITTKGDANSSADFMPVAYVDVLGKVNFHMPVLGFVAGWLSEVQGKIVAFMLLAIGALLSNINGKALKGSVEKTSNDSKGVKPKIILATGIVILCGSVCGFFLIFMGYKKSNGIYASIQDEYFKWPYEQYPEGPQGGEFPWYEACYVDMEGLQQLNPDVVGWLYVENTGINYPILYSGDDSKYLRMTMTHESATAGSIFLEGYNLPDFSDCHNIIYGHNMHNLSMFGTLKYYKSDKSYYDDHKYFQIITPEGRYRYEIFSYFDTEAASWVYTVPYYDNEEYAEYLNHLCKSSYKKIDTPVTSHDKVVTLSTCSSTGMRFTVHGALVDSKPVSTEEADIQED